MAGETTPPRFAQPANGEPVTPDAEMREVKKLRESYEQARKFDKAARRQYAIDRRYATGKAVQQWAVSTNLIGVFITVLVDALYARNPDVNVRAAARVEHTLAAAGESDGGPEDAERETEDFARTLELVISRLWRDGRLKKAVRKDVRSALSVGPGWLKVIFEVNKRTDPLVQTQLNDAQDNLARLQAQRKKIADGDVQDLEVAQRELQELIQGLEAKLEVIVRQGLAIDFCPAEDVQVALDVASLEDYLDAGWMGNAIYRPRADLEAMFPRLRATQCKQATAYYQRKPREHDHEREHPHDVTEKDADQFSLMQADDSGIEFVRIVEVWDHRDDLIKTWVDGIDAWARDPYPPPFASSRFFPYFYLAFREADGERHPQSLSGDLRKLQDEYSSVRSNFRLTRGRAIPGTIFNAEQVDPTNAKKLEQGVQQEFIGLKLTNPNTRMQDVFAEKPTAKVDPLLFDTTPILRDMEKVGGVQESQMNSVVQAKTATEAQIQQQGFTARSGADRDALEDMLTELAQYTAEIAIQALDVQAVQRMVGPGAFWPHGMSIEDLLTMVEVDITAGSTGKPNTTAERQAWSVALPLIRETMVQIQQAEAQGNLPLAQALTELLRETLYRMADNIDVDRFVPKLPAPAMPMAGAPAAPPVPGAAPAAPPGPIGPIGGLAAPLAPTPIAPTIPVPPATQ